MHNASNLAFLQSWIGLPPARFSTDQTGFFRQWAGCRNVPETGHHWLAYKHQFSNYNNKYVPPSCAETREQKKCVTLSTHFQKITFRFHFRKISVTFSTNFVDFSLGKRYSNWKSMSKEQKTKQGVCFSTQITPLPGGLFFFFSFLGEKWQPHQSTMAIFWPGAELHAVFTVPLKTQQSFAKKLGRRYKGYSTLHWRHKFITLSPHNWHKGQKLCALDECGWRHTQRITARAPVWNATEGLKLATWTAHNCSLTLLTWIHTISFLSLLASLIRKKCVKGALKTKYKFILFERFGAL